jgi:hypothetical protein
VQGGGKCLRQMVLKGYMLFFFFSFIFYFLKWTFWEFHQKICSRHLDRFDSSYFDEQKIIITFPMPFSGGENVEIGFEIIPRRGLKVGLLPNTFQLSLLNTVWTANGLFKI